VLSRRRLGGGLVPTVRNFFQFKAPVSSLVFELHLSMATRRVVVDDTNSGIRYTGSWFQANGQNDNLGNFGPPFQRTSHGVNEDASFSYTFTGELD